MHTPAPPLRSSVPPVPRKNTTQRPTKTKYLPETGVTAAGARSSPSSANNAHRTFFCTKPRKFLRINFPPASTLLPTLGKVHGRGESVPLRGVFCFSVLPSGVRGSRWCLACSREAFELGLFAFQQVASRRLQKNASQHGTRWVGDRT